ncbi:MAG: hypothetical protein ACK559_20690, partial [bacterium]
QIAELDPHPELLVAFAGRVPRRQRVGQRAPRADAAAAAGPRQRHGPVVERARRDHDVVQHAVHGAVVAGGPGVEVGVEGPAERETGQVLVGLDAQVHQDQPLVFAQDEQPAQRQRGVVGPGVEGQHRGPGLDGGHVDIEVAAEVGLGLHPRPPVAGGQRPGLKAAPGQQRGAAEGRGAGPAVGVEDEPEFAIDSRDVVRHRVARPPAPNRGGHRAPRRLVRRLSAWAVGVG